MFYRRKPYSACFIADNFELFKVAGTCPCTEIDFECDVEFYRNGPLCASALYADMDQPPKDCYDYYEIKSGYVKARDTQCIGGLVYPNIATNCPQHNTQM